MDTKYIIESPLKSWPGEIRLPQPDDFSGLHWSTYKDATNRPKRKAYALTHLYCYAGLELIAAHGEWEIGTAISEVQAWEDKPEEERIKLVAWLGRSIMTYMESIIDPKE